MNKELYLIPITSCLTTFGFCRSTICDFQQNEFSFIPNALANLLVSNKHQKLADIFSEFGQQNKEIIEEYLNHLQDNRFAYFGTKNEVSLFLDFNLEWDFPSKISNAVIDIRDYNKTYYMDLLAQLENLQCCHLQLRFYKEVKDINYISEVIELANNKSFRTISLYLNYAIFNDYDSCTKLIEITPKIDNITVYKAPVNKLVQLTDLMAFINYTNNEFNPQNTCGYIDLKFFAISVNHFTESQLHNTCLNRKICIDADGYIKNCPSMKHHYGHISDTTLTEAIEKPGFKDCWFIKKDDIDVCQDCEFRHICTDCRAFIKNPNNLYSQPAKCEYNPYIAKWQSEDGWISVEQWRAENPGWEEQTIEIRDMNKKHLANND
ncbi:MAG: grasp-with-spasm system SPASM domain peptide maturase [Bacteroidales bacterium]|jgi:SPASM domain peptide maturase of grasp-with-spasm system|nr:grasp-with-spasm system SPASM domain peptide maturase [Bacteroidales bacterium]MDD4218275.1 grasp-with-spasm system SPASM domain peptide maturase [Bacteroidales bacterium]MDY0142349.1 grasp-with-spasm system SPASM domain peptide maturase [Bacteroidales bacterium]